MSKCTSSPPSTHTSHIYFYKLQVGIAKGERIGSWLLKAIISRHREKPNIWKWLTHTLPVISSWWKAELLQGKGCTSFMNTEWGGRHEQPAISWSSLEAAAVWRSWLTAYYICIYFAEKEWIPVFLTLPLEGQWWYAPLSMEEAKQSNKQRKPNKNQNKPVNLSVKLQAERNISLYKVHLVRYAVTARNEVTGHPDGLLRIPFLLPAPGLGCLTQQEKAFESSWSRFTYPLTELPLCPKADRQRDRGWWGVCSKADSWQQPREFLDHREGNRNFHGAKDQLDKGWACWAKEEEEEKKEGDPREFPVLLSCLFSQQLIWRPHQWEHRYSTLESECTR